MSQRFISLSMLSAAAFLLAPLASAQGPLSDLSDEGRQEIRSELEACKANNEEHENRKACRDEVFTSRGLDVPEHRGRRGRRGSRRQDIPEEAREALEECKEDHSGNRDAMKECAQPIFEQYGIEPPHKGRGRMVGRKFRSQITETCGEREDTEQWKECAKEARSGLREKFQEERPQAFERFQNRRERRSNFREQLRACLELGDHDSLRACVIEVRDAIRESQ